MLVGVTITLAVEPVPAGDQLYAYGPPLPLFAAAVMVVLLPGHTEVAPLAITLSGGFTVTVTFTGAAGQPATSLAFTVYTVVEAGVTTTVAEDPVPAGVQL